MPHLDGQRGFDHLTHEHGLVFRSQVVDLAHPIPHGHQHLRPCARQHATPG
jgi:hypothetical protein